MATQTTGAIALRPTSNAQGGYYFLSLTTGRRLNRNRWTKLPMPADVIDRVHTLVRRQNAALGITFADRTGQTLDDPEDDDSDDESYDPDDDNGDSDDDDGDSSDDDDGNDDNGADEAAPDEPIANIAGVNDDQQIAGVNNEQVDEQDEQDDASNGHEEIENEEIDEPLNVEEDDDEEDNEDEGIEGDHTPLVETVHDEMVVEDETIDDNNQIEQEMDDKYGARSGKYNIRDRKAPVKPRDYGYQHATLESIR
jgi:hypothetical protein